MSSLINKIKAKATGKPSSPPKDSTPNSGSGEQSFTIQPHPAVSFPTSRTHPYPSSVAAEWC